MAEEKQCDSEKFAAKGQKDKRYNEQPTHKTIHPAKSYLPNIQIIFLREEQFSCQRTRRN